MQRQDVHDQLTTNMDVFGSDGDKVGKIVAIDPADAYMVVEKGFFFPTDYYIPLTAISRIDANGVFLAVTKDEALHQHWDVAPTTAADVGSTSTIPAAEWPETTATAPVGTAPIRSYTADNTEADTVVVPVAEEELTATKRPVERGAVRVEKDVVAEERTLEVPVTEERVHVARHAVDRPVTEADQVFEEGVIEVPVYGEQVELQKRVRVAEEVELTKEAVQRTEQVRGTVRREEVRVADATDADVVDATASRTGGRSFAWNPMTHADYDALTDQDVYSADGQKIGTIRTALHPRQDMPEARGRHYFLLDPTLIKDWFQGFDEVYLPESAITSVQPDRVVLNLTADQIKQRRQDWTRQPDGIGQYRWADVGDVADAAGRTV